MAQVLPEFSRPRGRASDDGASSSSKICQIDADDDGRGAHCKSHVEPSVAGGLLPKLGSALQALLLIAALAVAAYMHSAMQEMNAMLQDARRLSESSSERPLRSSFNRSSSTSLHEEQVGDDMLVDPSGYVPSRRLSIMSVGTSNSGCYRASSTATFDVSGANCNSKNCPSCFISADVPASATTITISSCSSHTWGIGTSSDVRSGVWEYTFINRGDTYDMTISDGTGSFVLTPRSFVHAFCSDTSDRLLFPTTTYPTMTVQSGLTLESGVLDASGSSSAVTLGTGGVTIGGGGLTVSAGGFTLTAGDFSAGSSPGAFTTSSGTNTLSGPTAMPGTGHTFDVGPGTSTLGGALAVGGALTVSGTATVTSDVTISTGDLTVTAGNFLQSSPTATFETGGGAVTVNGNTEIVNPATFTVGTPGNGGTSTIYGAVVVNTPGSAPAAVTVTGGVSTDELTSSGAFTLNGALDMSGGTGTVTTGAGAAVTLDGAVTISKGLTQGAAGDSTTVQLYGDLIVGNTAPAGATTTLYGVTTVKTGGLDVEAGGITLQAGDFDASPSNGAFTTSDGTVTLSGDTIVADGKAFTVGASPGNAASLATFYGGITVGEPGFSAGTSTIYNGLSVSSGALDVSPGDMTLGGAFTQSGANTFMTGTGAVTLKGGTVTVAPGALEVPGTGATNIFGGALQVTGTSDLTGDVTMGGALDISGATTLTSLSMTGAFDASNGGANTAAFATSSGTNTLNGNVAIADSKTLTVGSAGAGGAATLYGALTVGASGDEVNSAYYGKVTVTSPGTGLQIDGGGIVYGAAGGGFDASASPGNFVWGPGTATVGGATTLSGGLTVGSSSDDGSGGIQTTLHSSLVLGSPAGAYTGATSYMNLNFASPYSIKYAATAMTCAGTSPYYCSVNTR